MTDTPEDRGADRPDVLARICADKHHHVRTMAAEVPLAEREAQARDQAPPRGFKAALEAARDAGGTGLIAEIKRASPSKGRIRDDFDPAALARAYAAGGATCLSVLTDTPYFQGHDHYLAAARDACRLPVLRKDFILTPYQVVEARAIGADAILLILAALDDAEARTLADLARHWGMDVLVEVHDRAELDRAAGLGADLIGINNRDLKSLTVDLATTLALVPHAPETAHLVAESGLKTPADLQRCRDGGVTSFLVGEALMAQDDVTAATAALLAPAG
ncbi:indole-3-glycerol phosphate synthase [Rhodothalassium salexigens]|uniref:indole-3-glycerol phosphate synthase TrpC n=1 Tax=Rhodothalassium salexigens TaxID=1086 RepID=UPI0019148061|nr:indole-3-glycerol phosphate synthase TrpC [Rhodothalassium salexigens]MBK5920592.1 indole-3-glycerol phosphate synthase [Rhodothalassium salexigens]